jgi:hypothetical protein
MIFQPHVASNTTPDCAGIDPAHKSTAVVPSVCVIETSCVAPSFQTDSSLTLRVTLDAGDATTSVVVALVIEKLARSGVTVVPFKSTQDAKTPIVPAAPVVTVILSDVDVSRITARHQHITTQ